MATPSPAASSESTLSPAMKQHAAAKAAHPGALLFFRMGDFYELFYDDAVVASRELQLTLTARDKARSVPMCGVPYHSAATYLQRLLRRGFRVAICEQMEDPKLAKGVVRREVTRVLTPGTALDPTLAGGSSQWLAGICACGTGERAAVGLALLDLSTGDFRATEFTGPAAWPLAIDELSRLCPAEILSAEGSADFHAPEQTTLPEPAAGAPSTPKALATRAFLTGSHTTLEDYVFTPAFALPLLRSQLRVHSLDGMGLAAHDAAATAAGALVHYLRSTKQGALEHLDTLSFYRREDALELDSVSVRNLELVDPLFAGESAASTLLHTVDACCTPMGKRLLRSQLLRPLLRSEAIEARLDAVAAAADLRLREGVRRAMDGVLDLERLLGRIALDSAGPRDLGTLGATLGALPALHRAVTALAAMQAGRWNDLAGGFDDLADLRGRLTSTLVDDPPVTLNDGNVIRAGLDAELDDLRSLSTDGRTRIAAIEARERERTGIASLKVRFNSVFGYYIEITRTHAHAVPPDYERKQTLVNAERFTTPELKDLELRILTAQERSVEIERRLFAELRRDILTHAARIRATSRAVAEIDLLACFAHLAALRGWTRPRFGAPGSLEIVHGRHPVVERRLEEQALPRFTPNSLHLQAQLPDGADVAASASLLLITGPNMGGKSTYLRQAALLVILAQCGSFVPADSMTFAPADRIFTRIGASDNVASGRSTFMVEMTETAAILNTATAHSLILLDEMGRGTATYDGLSLAWAAVEHLHTHVSARTLFATHYHELTLLAEQLPRLRNARVSVRETAGGIVFLHTVEPGAASKSYGIEVARLAGLPAAVIARAREVLRLHERAESQQVRAAIPAANQAPPLQMTMFTPLSQRIVDRIEATDLDDLTPRDALTLLAELQAELKAGSA